MSCFVLPEPSGPIIILTIRAFLLFSCGHFHCTSFPPETQELTCEKIVNGPPRCGSFRAFLQQRGRLRAGGRGKFPVEGRKPVRRGAQRRR